MTSCRIGALWRHPPTVTATRAANSGATPPSLSLKRGELVSMLPTGASGLRTSSFHRRAHVNRWSVVGPYRRSSPEEEAGDRDHHDNDCRDRSRTQVPG